MLKDSGNRTTFGDGAQRDMEVGKGRCDLLPLSTIGIMLGDSWFLDMDKVVRLDNQTAVLKYLEKALLRFCGKAYDANKYEMFLDVAKQYEAGVEKYSERNWEKGMPLWVFYDSAIRHYLKWLAKREDEPHDRAVTWNLIGAMWTIEQEVDKKNKKAFEMEYETKWVPLEKTRQEEEAEEEEEVWKELEARLAKEGKVFKSE